MRLLAVLALLLLASACATPRAGKMSFADLYGASTPLAERGEPPAPAPPAALAPVAPPAPAAPPVLARSGLEGLVGDFVAQAGELRLAHPGGGRLPAPLEARWWALLADVDRTLAAAPLPEPVLGRARAALQESLAEDARRFGFVPPELSQAVFARLARLGVRQGELQRARMPRFRGPAQALAWPISPVAVTSVFGLRLHPVLGVERNHLGVDLAAAHGQRVWSAAAGLVVRASTNGGYGLQVEVHHADGRLTRYSHLSRLLVRRGQVVKRGQAVGLAGDTGVATGTHLHFEVWRAGRPLDPLEALGPELDRVARAHADHALPEKQQGRRPSTGRRP